ncbi:TetR/AcrR family transcriptional regulator [Sanguibacter sp. A247]|uniref:TetR/AcrR family transcriptional regulator n=1 Tax=unclassified Sanguibacter TaxID=2645534 RepID=UPI003FD6E536
MTEPRPRGAARRAALVDAAVELVLADGPAALTHRALAAHADLPLASTTYHFATLDDILAAVGARLAERWVAAVHDVLDDDASLAQATTPAKRAAVLGRALLPPGGDAAVRAHYEHLVGAGRTGLGRAYAAARGGLDDAIARLLSRLGHPGGGVSAGLALAVVDGAAVAALSEARSVRATVESRLCELLELGRPARAPAPTLG